MNVRSRLSSFKEIIMRFVIIGPLLFSALCLSSLTGCAGLFPTNPELTETSPCSQAPKNQLTANKTFSPSPRATKLPAVKLVVNNEVQRELNDLSQKNRRTVSRAIEQRAENYSTISQIFKDEGVPQELVNVAFLESGFNTEARSPAGAIGMWQFMSSTAKYYGLKINFHQDERKDLILSSLAAARHLRDLYSNYEDWYLALAAYNVGPGGIERAMERGGTRDFWALARKGLLPKETARFVPKFLAASLIMNDPEAFGFNIDGTSAVG